MHGSALLDEPSSVDPHWGNSLKYKRLARVLSVLAVIVAAVALTPAAANAEANPPGCGKGYFCAYSGINETGTLLIHTFGNWTGMVSGVKSVFNNGNPCGGCDHVDMLFYAAPPTNETWCIHYNPGPGTYKLNFDFTGGIIVKGITWRGECSPGGI